MSKIVWICVAGMAMLRPDSGIAQSALLSRPTNVEQLQKVVHAAVEKILQEAGFRPGQCILVKSVKDENAWLIDQSTYDVIMTHGMRIMAAEMGDSAHADGSLEIFSSSLSVRYSPIFRDGLFGEALTVRTVEGKFSTSVIRKDGTVQLAATYTETVADTIAVSDLPSIEHPTFRAAHGEPPALGFFDTLLEPLVILGTLAIVVYLLFTVRS
jgi:hypothetical protein